jgi:GMP synthase-like glutamine amidotransferase
VIIQHASSEGPYAIADALSAAGVTTEVRHVSLGERLPADARDLSGLVVMGGAMSATSDEGFSTRSAELSLIASALEASVPILGICLGAQLLAAAAGGVVFRGEQGPEIGWGEISLGAEAVGDPLLAELPSTMRVLHWHGDTFTLPPSAVHLASSEVYVNQAFRVGSSAWGLQFHLEVDAPAVAAFLAAFGDEADQAGVPAASIASGAQEALRALGPICRAVTSRFASLVAAFARGEMTTELG